MTSTGTAKPPASPSLESFIHTAAASDAEILERLNLIAIWSGEIDYASKKMINSEASEQVEYSARITEAAVCEYSRRAGEAVKKIPDDVKAKYPYIPWDKLSTIRDAVAHMDEAGKHAQVIGFLEEQGRNPDQAVFDAKNICNIRLEAGASPEVSKALEELKFSVKIWVGICAIHRDHFHPQESRKEQIRLIFQAPDDRKFFDGVFGANAPIEFIAASHFLRISGGNLAVKLSALFQAYAAGPSGYAAMPVSWKAIRNASAHSHANSLPDGRVSYEGVANWVHENGSCENLAKLYRDGVLKDLDPAKIKVLQTAVSKFPGANLRINHQQAFLLALSELGRDPNIAADTLNKAAIQGGYLATAKQQDIAPKNMSRSIHHKVEPYVKRIITFMQRNLGIREALQVS